MKQTEFHMLTEALKRRNEVKIKIAKMKKYFCGQNIYVLPF